MSVVVCRRIQSSSSSVTLPACGPAGRHARGRSGRRRPGAWAVGRPTLHCGPVWLRPFRHFHTVKSLVFTQLTQILVCLLLPVARVDELLKTQGDGSHVTSSQMIDARKTLILDLSSKVTEQETEIMRLREQLRAHAHNRAADTSETSTVGSEMPEYSWKSSEESSSRLRFDERDIRPTASGRDANGDRSSTLGRITLPPVDSCSKNSAEPRQTAGRYRAHWASSCFDVQDQVDGDDGNVLMAETQPASATQT